VVGGLREVLPLRDRFIEFRNSLDTGPPASILTCVASGRNIDGSGVSGAKAAEHIGSLFHSAMLPQKLQIRPRRTHRAAGGSKLYFTE
jgi:hypothetical protein